MIPTMLRDFIAVVVTARDRAIISLIMVSSFIE
jgi:hypothetical protein